MKKRILKGSFYAILGFLVVICSGCSWSNEKVVLNNLSEVTQTYYQGEGTNFSSNISVGQREENYALDGVSCDNVGFTLVTIITQSSSSAISATLTVDDDEFNITLDYNPVTQTFMVDLGCSLDGDESISIKFSGEEIALARASDNFAIDWKNALSISCEQFADEVQSLRQGNNLLAESYLKIMSSSDFDGEIFWCFTMFTQQGESYSIIISALSGQILAKT